MRCYIDTNFCYSGVLQSVLVLAVYCCFLLGFTSARSSGESLYDFKDNKAGLRLRSLAGCLLLYR